MLHPHQYMQEMRKTRILKNQKLNKKTMNYSKNLSVFSSNALYRLMESFHQEGNLNLILTPSGLIESGHRSIFNNNNNDL